MKVDLLVTDLIMPGGMTGSELVREARLRQPGLPAMLISGYVTGDMHEDEAPDVPMLAKPYRLTELARVVRAALQGTKWVFLGIAAAATVMNTLQNGFG
jgi:CheY-like chemotaxis protein